MNLVLQNPPQKGFQSEINVIVSRKNKKAACDWCRLNVKGKWNHFTIENGGIYFYFSTQSDLNNFRNNIKCEYNDLV